MTYASGARGGPTAAPAAAGAGERRLHHHHGVLLHLHLHGVLLHLHGTLHLHLLRRLLLLLLHGGGVPGDEGRGGPAAGGGGGLRHLLPLPLLLLLLMLRHLGGHLLLAEGDHALLRHDGLTRGGERRGRVATELQRGRGERVRHMEVVFFWGGAST